VPFAANSEFVSNYIFPIVLNDSTVEYRDEVRSKLHQAGIQTSVHYPAANRFSIYRQYDHGGLEHSEYATDNEITLPMYARLTVDQIDYIAETLQEILR
jgi:dTDP-4-amino-4,6-dideoxygalactose transaminase